MKRALAPLLGLALALAAGAARAATDIPQVDDPKAADALVAFTRGCVITRGAADQIAEKMREFNGVKLPDATAIAVAHGKPGSQAWKLASPHDAEMILTWTPPLHCEVLIRKADARSLQDGIVSVLDQLAKGGEMHFHLEHHSEQPTEGGNEERTEYILQMIRNQDASVTVVTTKSTTADIQGALIFAPL